MSAAVLCACGVLGLTTAACGGGNSDKSSNSEVGGTINGAGSTFAAPIYDDPCKAGMITSKADDLKFFLDYLVSNGQTTIKQLSYAPLPAALRFKDRAAIGRMHCNGAALGA